MLKSNTQAGNIHERKLTMAEKLAEKFTSAERRINVYSNVQQKAYGNGFVPYEVQITSKLSDYDDLNVEAIRFSSHPEDSEFTFPVRNIKFSSFLLFYFMHLPLVNLFAPLMKRSLNSKINSKPDDVFIFYENKIPNIKLNGKIIAVLHDIIPLRVRNINLRNTSRLENFMRRCIVERNARDILSIADKIITVSEYSKRDILDYFKLEDDGRIEVVYSSMDYVYYHQRDDLKLIRERYALPEKYVLYFGSCIPHKNVNTLIRAYSKLPESLRREYKLVVTNPLSPTIDCVNRCSIQDDVYFVSNVPEEDKTGIFQVASLFVWPSIYEGFGLPVIEAMASGVPVICSNSTSMPEVAGDAAVLVDPHDDVNMSREIERVLNDENLRREMIAKGYENIKRFSWDNSAKKVHDIIINLR